MMMRILNLYYYYIYRVRTSKAFKGVIINYNCQYIDTIILIATTTTNNNNMAKTKAHKYEHKSTKNREKKSKPIRLGYD